MKGPAEARDYTMTDKDLANLRDQHARLTWKLHSEDAQSLKLMVRRLLACSPLSVLSTQPAQPALAASIDRVKYHTHVEARMQRSSMQQMRRIVRCSECAPWSAV